MNPRARNTDPYTSHAAAANVRRFDAGQCRMIRLALIQNPQGIGAEQIAKQIGIAAYAVRKRLPEMASAGLCKPTDELRVTETGRHERIWVPMGVRA
jgi:predicted ArsR family transcriptional regulator